MALCVSCEVELDDVRVERALREEVDLAEPCRLLLEDADEGRPDPAALLLRVDDAGERVEELVGGVDVDELDVALRAHHVDDAIALTAPQEAVVDEDAGQLVADGAVHQGRRDRGVHAAAQRADHLAVADLTAERGHRHLDEGRRLPRPSASAHVDEEVAEEIAPERRVRDLGVELDPVPLTRTDESGAGGVERMRDGVKPLRKLRDDVAVRHPDGELAGHLREEP